MDERLEFEPVASSVRSARLFVVDKLQEWRCDDLVDRVALLTSELATNAVVHTHQPYSVSVQRRGPAVRVEVRDHAQELPVRHETIDLDALQERVPAGSSASPSNDSERWFSGLGIVDATATAWGSERIPGGKVVWFEVVGDERGPATDARSDLQDLREVVPAAHHGDDVDEWLIALEGPRLPGWACALVVGLVVAVVLVVAVLVRG